MPETTIEEKKKRKREDLKARGITFRAMLSGPMELISR